MTDNRQNLLIEVKILEYPLQLPIWFSNLYANDCIYQAHRPGILQILNPKTPNYGFFHPTFYCRVLFACCNHR